MIQNVLNIALEYNCICNILNSYLAWGKLVYLFLLFSQVYSIQNELEKILEIKLEGWLVADCGREHMNPYLIISINFLPLTVPYR